MNWRCWFGHKWYHGLIVDIGVYGGRVFREGRKCDRCNRHEWKPCELAGWTDYPKKQHEAEVARLSKETA